MMELNCLIHGKYPKHEIHNLARFISVQKFLPSSRQTGHPYILVDHFEDVTPPERVHMNNKCDRNITLYGYLRECNLKKGTKMRVWKYVCMPDLVYYLCYQFDQQKKIIVTKYVIYGW